ncbi:MAG: hypothetical protein SGI77_15895 [Pirellulaceae bacterium]|nr:hypothetical protein [Pirellulaceae bacterium]
MRITKTTHSFCGRAKSWEASNAAERKKPAAERKKQAKKPIPPKRPLDTEGQPGVLYNSMIHPFVGYSIRGAIWYQGEANAKPGAVPYDQSLPLMIRDWRYAWATNPEGANLINSEGLPASIFRTDDWDDVETLVPAK